ncbi:MAG: YncE family protein [Acidobacteriaceae bacterium]
MASAASSTSSGASPIRPSLSAAPEFLAADASGEAYVNLENNDLVVVVDLHSRKVIARWPVAPGGHPVGMAIDPAAHLLFFGCRNPQKLIVMNTKDGAVVGRCQSAAELTPRASMRARRLPAPVSARTMGLDRMTGRIFPAAAEVQPSADGHRPRPKPGTFMIVEVGRK